MLMSLWQQLLVALVQGATAILPVASSSHGMLPLQLLGWPLPSLVTDIAIQSGIVLAILCYGWRDFLHLTSGWWQSVKGQHSPQGWLSWGLLLSAIPALLGYWQLREWLMSIGHPLLIVAATLIFAMLLQWADSSRHYCRLAISLSWAELLLLMAAQVLGLLPGASFTGVVITALLVIGYERVAAARLAILLSLPIHLMMVAAASQAMLGEAVPIYWTETLLLFGSSFIAALLAFHLLLTLLKQFSFWPLTCYRLLLGTVLLLVLVTA